MVVAVHKNADGAAQIELRSTDRVRGQAAQTWRRHPSLVARCHTVVDSLEDLLKQEGLHSAVRVQSVDALAHWHAGSSVV